MYKRQGEYERITAPQGSPGQFNDTLVDGRQYFVTYDKENANKANTMLFNKLEFNIQNDRKVGKTILEIIGCLLYTSRSSSLEIHQNRHPDFWEGWIPRM